MIIKRRRLGIGRRLVQLRADFGMTQGQAAGEIGVAQNTLSNWERNATHPNEVNYELVLRWVAGKRED